MIKRKERTINHSDTSTVQDAHVVSTDVAEVLIAANEMRTELNISVIDDGAWIRFMPASVEPSIRKGIHLLEDGSYWNNADNIYRGEVSVINKKNGKSPSVYVTEIEINQ